VIAAALGGHGPLARLFPGPTTTDPGAQTATARLQLFAAVGRAVGRLARIRPVLLLLDDLQWASDATRQLLGHLLGSLTDERVAIGIAQRVGDPTHDVDGVVGLAGRVTRIELKPLVEADLQRLVEATWPDVTSERATELARASFTGSGGAPLFAVALLDHLAAGGQVDDIATTPAVPASIQQLVEALVAQLGPAGSELVQLAATSGAGFDRGFVALASGQPQGEVDEVLAAAVTLGLVRTADDRWFSFGHALVRGAVLDGVGGDERRALHRRVAEALEAEGGERFDELAHHWQAAGDAQRSTRHLAGAARRDLAALDFESALTRFEQVVALLSRDALATIEDRAAAWLGVAAAQRALGLRSYLDAIQKAAAMARAAGLVDLLVEAAVLSVWPGAFFNIAGASDPALVSLCEEALALLAPDDGRRVQVAATLATQLTFVAPEARRRALLDEARALARSTGDRWGLAHVLTSEFVSLWQPNTLVQREEIARQLGGIAVATGDPEHGFFARVLRRGVRNRAGRTPVRSGPSGRPGRAGRQDAQSVLRVPGRAVAALDRPGPQRRRGRGRRRPPGPGRRPRPAPCQHPRRHRGHLGAANRRVGLPAG
jgi:hypothetical protein